MAAIDFPDSPSVNDTFTANDRTWIWTGTRWNTVETGTISGPTGPTGETGTPGRYTVSETAPTGPTAGDAWFKSDTARLYIYYDNYWVENTSNFVGPTGPSGDPTLTVQTAKTANYTITSTDVSQLIRMNSASTLTLSIPTDATYNFAVGTQINVVQTGAGQVTIAAVTPATTTVNATPGLKLRAQWSGATLVKLSANNWWVSGDLSA